jgi:hypothetical protein
LTTIPSCFFARRSVRSAIPDPFAAYETVLTVGYMLRTLMVDTLGAEATERAVELAGDTAAEGTAAELCAAGSRVRSPGASRTSSSGGSRFT